ncbi:DAK2 domain-containing protein [Actinoplanes sp. TRM 88003]|uniref:DAK2 domain-containing protein n=1 Tax=Paractinoplanes aksuensis TaxID=2939490 RepID=A0ABT1DPJ0_9ACTN|nr:DAK2 domain-containing protein [Actinoplanes aksuensis]MCO8271971.1 DAK2 domain-containing protein [Actinoplanes aksuensis]
MLETLDAAAVRRWCGGGLTALRAHQREIDELNVYPVPDGDTGTNLVLTLTSAQEALDASTTEPAGPAPASGAPEASAPGNALRRMARGALLGARGNSGVIVSQILRGMADSVAATAAVRGAELARALRSASEAAYAAVARPVEGTVLTVAAAAADAASRLKSDDLIAVARAAARAAAEALARTPQQLPALARAGVVDAGGRGLVVLLEALVDALSPPTTRSAAANLDLAFGPSPALEPAVGPASAEPDSSTRATADSSTRATADGSMRAIAHGSMRATADGSTPAMANGSPPAAADGHRDRSAGGEGSWGYEVQYLLDAAAGAVDRLKEQLDALGDSLVVVGTGDPGVATWNVHVHVPAAAIGPAIEAGVRAGRPYDIAVTPLDEYQHDHAERAAVVVAAGDGLTALFEAEGATVVGRNPSTREMLAAIQACRARRVVLLPNDANTQAVALSAAREAEAGGLRVSVVPTRSPVQALAALAVRDPGRPFADDVIAMAEAAGACRYGEVCTAQRDSLTVAGPCRAGDLLGLVDGEVHVIGDDLAEVSARLLDRMLGGGGELVTLVLGADAPATLEGVLREHAGRAWPFAELHCYTGGQPRYHLLVGVE